MKYYFAGEYLVGHPLSGTIAFGAKETVGQPYLTDAVLPSGLAPEIVDYENPDTGEVFWRIVLQTPSLNNQGDYGFCVRSDKSGVEPLTCVFTVRTHR